MKLYIAPGACSLSPHIVLREAGIAHSIEKVDLKAKKTESGADFSAINPKGYVPTLQLDDGSILTEGPVIVQYLADQKPDSGLAAKAGSKERYKVQEWLNFISTELHKQYSPLFNPTFDATTKKFFADKLGGRYAWLNTHFATNQYLMGNDFCVADAYLFTVLNWASRVNIDLSQWPNVQAYHARVAARPKVQEAMKAEGLIK